ncbi:hypothetical protein GCM10009678_10050 [Actinomadura kijaniata]|uniref:Uncharacterized protein n=1 Tax=Actinomadura namibiensis TaxID=182080 RepID=A0A7W3QJD4_ACTNM|nr:hypothetical protein [Actinomadura namibiensis]
MITIPPSVALIVLCGCVAYAAFAVCVFRMGRCSRRVEFHAERSGPTRGALLAWATPRGTGRPARSAAPSAPPVPRGHG